MQISFYVLTLPESSSSASDAKNAGDTSQSNTLAVTTLSTHDPLVLNFICKLMQTVLDKSELSVVILSDDHKLLQLLDTQLWTFSASSFIPHVYEETVTVQDNVTNQTKSSRDASDTATDVSASSKKQSKPASLVTPPVLLTSTLLPHFDGALVNLTAEPLLLSNQNDGASSTTEPTTQTDKICAQRVVEIIAPDSVNKEQGRKKYAYYQQLGYQPKYHPITLS